VLQLHVSVLVSVEYLFIEFIFIDTLTLVYIEIVHHFNDLHHLHVNKNIIHLYLTNSYQYPSQLLLLASQVVFWLDYHNTTLVFGTMEVWLIH